MVPEEAGNRGFIGFEGVKDLPQIEEFEDAAKAEVQATECKASPGFGDLGSSPQQMPDSRAVQEGDITQVEQDSIHSQAQQLLQGLIQRF